MVNLQEAFSKLNMMESNEYELLDQEEKDAMKDFLNDDELEAEDVEVIDPQADDESELEDSYIGKIIVQCPVCKSLIFKTREELDEAGDEPQTCPYCFSVENFDLIGKIVPIEDEEAPEAPVEMEDEEDSGVQVSVEPKDLQERFNRRHGTSRRRRLREDLENVQIETENEIINVSSEPKDNDMEDTSYNDFSFDDMEEEPEEVEHEESEVIAPLEGAEGEEESSNEDEIDEVDEESFDEMAESLLRENYNNITSYKTKRMIDRGTHIVAEGIVTLKGGKKRLTEFRIRPSKFSRNGKGACLVENLQLGKKKVVPARVSMNEGIFDSKKDKKSGLAKAMNCYGKSDKEMWEKGARYYVHASDGGAYFKKRQDAEAYRANVGGKLYSSIHGDGKFDYDEDKQQMADRKRYKKD